VATDPYTPPSAELVDAPRKPWKPWAAVLIGLLVDVGGTVATGAVLGVVLGIYLASTGMDPKQVGESFADLAQTPSVTAISTVLGAFFSAFGGWLCIRLAQRTDYKLALVLSVLSCACGFLFGGTRYSFAIQLLFVGITVASVLLGARLGMRRK
jgi:hypothetical protein